MDMKLIQDLRSTIIQLKKEYNELSKESQEARDFYENHMRDGKWCEHLIEDNRKIIENNNHLKLKIRWGQNGNRISSEFLCSLYYDGLIDKDKYNKLYPEHSMNSYSMLGEHLCSDKLATEVYILNHEDKQMAIDRHEHEEYMEEMRAEKNNNINMNSTFSTKERTNAPVETKKEDEPIVLTLTPEIVAEHIKKLKKDRGEQNETNE